MCVFGSKELEKRGIEKRNSLLVCLMEKELMELVSGAARARRGRSQRLSPEMGLHGRESISSGSRVRCAMQCGSNNSNIRINSGQTTTTMLQWSYSFFLFAKVVTVAVMGKE